jgi:hypothetical protein
MQIFKVHASNTIHELERKYQQSTFVNNVETVLLCNCLRFASKEYDETLNAMDEDMMKHRLLSGTLSTLINKCMIKQLFYVTDQHTKA